MVNQGPFRTVRERATSLAPWAETSLLQINTQIIQEGDNTQESQQSQKTNSLCLLPIWEVLQESTEDQRQKIRRVDQESLRENIRGHEIDCTDVIFPTRVITQVTGAPTNKRG